VNGLRNYTDVFRRGELNNIAFANLEMNNINLYYVVAHDLFRYGLDTALVRREYGAIQGEF